MQVQLIYLAICLVAFLAITPNLDRRLERANSYKAMLYCIIGILIIPGLIALMPFIYICDVLLEKKRRRKFNNDFRTTEKSQ